MKFISLGSFSIFLSFLALNGCTSEQMVKPATPKTIPKSTPTLTTPATPLTPQIIEQPPTLTIEKTIRQPIPETYTAWLSQVDHQQLVNSYKAFLSRNQADFIVPDYQMLRSARDWQQCNYTEYEVPPAEVWQNAVPTLKLLRYLHQQGIIPNVEVTSSYRSPFLNKCAGGARTSSHVKNAAIDFRIGPEQPTPEDEILIHNTKMKLCRFWQQNGKAFNMGLGVYESGQIHIDTLGYRTWGYSHSWRSSLCGEIIPE